MPPKTITIASAPTPNGREPRLDLGLLEPAGQAPRRRRRPPAAARCRASTRWRISSRATTVTACCSSSRSNGPSGPPSRDGDEPRLRPPPRRRPAAPASGRRPPACSGANVTALAPPANASSPTASSAAGGELAERLTGRHRLAARAEHAGRAADRLGDRLHERVEPVLLEHQPLEPLVDRDAALEHLVLLVDEPRHRPLGQRDERHVVRHLEQREAELARLVEQRRRQLVVGEAGAEPERRRARARSSRSTNARSSSSPSIWSPVVSSSSPPDSHGVGSGSSVMWTQRTGVAAAGCPAASSSPSPSTRLPTVSIRATP